MRTTVALDDRLIARAQELTGIAEKSALIDKALRSLVEYEAGMRLARLGGTMPDIEAPPRRRFPPE